MPYQKPKTKKATIADFKLQLAHDPRWALRGLMRIYQEQTNEEQNAQSCTRVNGRGFTRVDVDFLTGLAQYYEAHKSLSDSQLAYLMLRMPKYATQLYELTYQRERR